MTKAQITQLKAMSVSCSKAPVARLSAATPGSTTPTQCGITGVGPAALGRATLAAVVFNTSQIAFEHGIPYWVTTVFVFAGIDTVDVQNVRLSSLPLLTHRSPIHCGNIARKRSNL